MTKLFTDAGVISLAAFISPYNTDRKRLKQIVGEDDFIEIYCDCPLEVCEKRDTKGLYAKARAGIIRNFTGIDSPYEAPQNPDVEIKTQELSVEESMQKIIEKLLPRIEYKND